MKKIIALLLLAVTCFSLVACGNKAEKEIVGEWKCENYAGREESLIFNDDGTGTDVWDEMTWKYDKELSCYVIASGSGQMMSVPHINTDDDGKEYVEFASFKFYRVEK